MTAPPDVLDELRALGEELRQVFADERAAIARLDHAQLGVLADHKHELATRLAAIRDAALATGSPNVKPIFEALRVEAHATQVLAAAASDAVRALLGYETPIGYDHRARRLSASPTRILTAM